MGCPAQCVRLLFFLSCLRCARASCSEIVNVTLSIKEDSNIHGGCLASDTNTSQLVCPDLQSALKLLANNSSSECWDASIVLRTGQNVLEEPVNLSTYALLLTGSGPGSIIVCSKSMMKVACNSMAGHVKHSIYFNRSRSVRIANLSLKDCPCPFRYDRVVNVSVQASSFRFARTVERVTFHLSYNCKTDKQSNAFVCVS